MQLSFAQQMAQTFKRTTLVDLTDDDDNDAAASSASSSPVQPKRARSSVHLIDSDSDDDGDEALLPSLAHMRVAPRRLPVLHDEPGAYQSPAANFPPSPAPVPATPAAAPNVADGRLGACYNDRTDDDRLYLDDARIDMTLYEAGLDTPVMRQAIARAYKIVTTLQHLKGREVKLSTLRRLWVRGSRHDVVVANILAGRTQLGKTETVAASLYIASVCLGLVGLGLVRNSGGLETIKSLLAALKEIGQSVVFQLARDMPELTKRQLAFFQPEAEQTKDFCKRAVGHSSAFVNRSRGLILVDRNNVSTLTKLFFDDTKSRFVHEWTNAGAKMTDENGLLRYALIVDEDDEATSTAFRNGNKTERLAHRQHTAINAAVPSDMGGRSDDSPGTTSDEEEEDDDQDDQAGPASAAVNSDGSSTAGDQRMRRVLDYIKRSPRGHAKLLAVASATWVAVGMIVQDVVRQDINLVHLPLKDTYVGLYADNTGRDRFVTWVDEVPEAQHAKGAPIHQVYDTAISYVMRRLVRRYSGIRAVHGPGGDPRGADPHVQPYISLHINCPKTKNTDNAVALCNHLVHVYEEVPLLCFVWNSRRQQIMISSTLRDRLHRAHQQLQDVVTTFAENANFRLALDETADTEASFKLPLQHRLIQKMYDIAIEVFNAVGYPPFIVCISGHMGGRGLTLKDSKHRLLLTDQFYDIPNVALHPSKSVHYEGVIQAAGRICSVDGEQIARTIWMPPTTAAYLRQALRFYEDLTQLAAQIRGPTTLDKLLQHLEPTHRGIRDTFDDDQRITRPRIQDPVNADLMSAIPVMPAQAQSQAPDDPAQPAARQHTLVERAPEQLSMDEDEGDDELTQDIRHNRNLIVKLLDGDAFRAGCTPQELQLAVANLALLPASSRASVPMQDDDVRFEGMELNTRLACAAGLDADLDFVHGRWFHFRHTNGLH